MTVSFAYAKALRAAAASHFGGDGRDVSTLHKRCVEREEDSTRQTVLEAVFSAQDSWQELRAEEAYLRVDFSSATPPAANFDPRPQIMEDARGTQLTSGRARGAASPRRAWACRRRGRA